MIKVVATVVQRIWVTKDKVQAVVRKAVLRVIWAEPAPALPALRALKVETRDEVAAQEPETRDVLDQVNYNNTPGKTKLSSLVQKTRLDIF